MPFYVFDMPLRFYLQNSDSFYTVFFSSNCSQYFLLTQNLISTEQSQKFLKKISEIGIVNTKKSENLHLKSLILNCTFGILA